MKSKITLNQWIEFFNEKAPVVVPENLELLDGKLTSNESVEEELQLEDDISVNENTLNEVSVFDDLMAHEKLIEEKQFKNKKIEKKQLRKVGWKGEWWGSYTA